jgi:hypothetical protein
VLRDASGRRDIRSSVSMACYTLFRELSEGITDQRVIVETPGFIPTPVQFLVAHHMHFVQN